MFYAIEKSVLEAHQIKSNIANVMAECHRINAADGKVTLVQLLVYKLVDGQPVATGKIVVQLNIIHSRHEGVLQVIKSGDFAYVCNAGPVYYNFLRGHKLVCSKNMPIDTPFTARQLKQDQAEAEEDAAREAEVDARMLSLREVPSLVSPVILARAKLILQVLSTMSDVTVTSVEAPAQDQDVGTVYKFGPGYLIVVPHVSLNKTEGQLIGNAGLIHTMLQPYTAHMLPYGAHGKGHATGHNEKTNTYTFCLYLRDLHNGGDVIAPYTDSAGLMFASGDGNDIHVKNGAKPGRIVIDTGHHEFEIINNDGVLSVTMLHAKTVLTQTVGATVHMTDSRHKNLISKRLTALKRAMV